LPKAASRKHEPYNHTHNNPIVLTDLSSPQSTQTVNLLAFVTPLNAPIISEEEKKLLEAQPRQALNFPHFT